MRLGNATAVAPDHILMMQGMLTRIPESQVQARKILTAEIYRLVKVASPGASRVYFIEAAEGSRIKIGVTKNLSARFASLATSSPVPLILIGSVRGCREIEKHWHLEFADIRASGEWFEATDRLRRTIALAMQSEA